MIDFLDKDGVICFDKMVGGDNCAMQHIKEEVLTWYREIFTDTTKGVKWYKYINAIEIDEELKQAIKADISKAIYNTNLVKEIKNLTIEKNNQNKTITISYQVVLVDSGNTKEDKYSTI